MHKEIDPSKRRVIQRSSEETTIRLMESISTMMTKTKSTSSRSSHKISIVHSSWEASSAAPPGLQMMAPFSPQRTISDWTTLALGPRMPCRPHPREIRLTPRTEMKPKRTNTITLTSRINSRSQMSRMRMLKADQTIMSWMTGELLVLTTLMTRKCSMRMRSRPRMLTCSKSYTIKYRKKNRMKKTDGVIINRL